MLRRAGSTGIAGDSRFHRNPDAIMPVVAHLEELRRRLAVALAVTLVAAVGLGVVWLRLLTAALAPVAWAHLATSFRLVTLSPMEPFMTVVDVVLAAAVVVASPVWIYEAWAFLQPAVPAPHRRWVGQALFAALGLFWMGTATAFALVIPASLRFLLTFAAGVFTETVRADAYLGFVTTFSLALGGVFTLPVWLTAGVKLGWLTPQRLQRGRRWAVFASAALSAAVVPSQDPLTLLAAALPLYALYEGTVQLSRWIRPVSSAVAPGTEVPAAR